MSTERSGDEVYWTLGICLGPKNDEYFNHRIHTEECCLNAGVYPLKCMDDAGDGWDGGFLKIQGKQYCGNFNAGDEEAVNVNIVTGKYGFRTFWMSGST